MVSFSVDCVHRFVSDDPWNNLAREELLLEALPPGESRLLLYVNRPCVVLGKHQNPLREVRLEEARRRNLPLVRRASGGGTVYHDEGNLNWSFLLPKDRYDRESITRAVAEALVPLGVHLTIGEKGDLFLGDRKVSGAAYLFRRDRVLHHGTLLCQARLDDLHGVLGPTGTVTEWVGVSSRPMPVTNLGLTVERAAQALAAYGPSALDAQTAIEEPVLRRREERRSRAWLWEQTPPFTWEGETRRGRLKVRVVGGRIEAAWDDRSQIMSNMVGKRFFDPELFAYLPGEVV